MTPEIWHKRWAIFIDKLRSGGRAAWRYSTRPSQIWLYLFLLLTAVGALVVFYTSSLSETSLGTRSTLEIYILYTKHDPDDEVRRGVEKLTVVKINPVDDGINVVIPIFIYEDDLPGIAVSALSEASCNILNYDDARIRLNASTVVASREELFSESMILLEPIIYDKEFFKTFVDAPFTVTGRVHIGVWCHTNVAPHKDSFTDRRIVVKGGQNPFPLRLEGHPNYYFSSEYVVDFSDLLSKEGLRSWGGTEPDIARAEQPLSASAVRQVKPWSPVNVAWRETAKLLQRDVALILSGALFGLAGAFLVEWVKARSA